MPLPERSSFLWMATRWWPMTKGTGPSLSNWFVGLVNDVDQAVDNAAEQLAEEGQEFVRNAIDTRGTGRVWKRTYTRNGKRRSGSSPGRVWTGQMWNDVEDESFRYGKDTAVARFGWINRFEEYYGLQEGGFDHPITGEVKGMEIMGDAEDFAVKRASDILGAELRRV